MDLFGKLSLSAGAEAPSHFYFVGNGELGYFKNIKFNDTFGVWKLMPLLLLGDEIKPLVLMIFFADML